jgi:hypothetical protein
LDLISPDVTYMALLIVQALHLLHHRLVKRHISFVEVVTAGVLCVSPTAPIPALILVVIHVALIVIQIVGSLFIDKLSPDWDGSK